MPTRRSRRVTLAAAALTVLVVAPLAAADSPTGARAASAPDTARAGSRTAAESDDQYGIPPFDNNPYVDIYQIRGKVSAQAAKLKTTIDFPETRLLSYTRLCAEVIQEGSGDPTYCPAFHPPKTTFDTFDNPGFPVWIYADGPLWVESPAGSARPYGLFPPVRVNTLAFGSIPVSATVTVSQPVGSDGTVTPLELSYLTTASPLPAEGGTVFATDRFGGFAFPPNDGSQYGVPSAKVTGTADVTVSDVEIDGRRVDVGNRCRTATPGKLELLSPAGYYPVSATASSLRGRPGGSQPLSPTDAGSLQGTVSIPKFSGCRNGNENLDPLLTSFVSGPDNPLDVPITDPLRTCASLEGTESACPPFPRQQPAGQAQLRTARSATANPPTSSAMWNRLTAQQRAQVAARLARAPIGVRSALVPSLPKTIQAAVRNAAG